MTSSQKQGAPFRLPSALLPLLLFLLVSLGSLPAAPVADTNATRFGFSGPETFPIDNSIAHLRAADLDGDRLIDLVVVNNARSKITLLYNQTGKTNAVAASKPRKLELNELPPDARFRIDSIASEKRIAALVLADLNGDARPDLAYYGEPKELVVQYNEGSNTWSNPKRWPIDDGQLTPNALATGDLNGDGRTDIVLLGETTLYFLAQRPDHTLGEPERIPFSGTLKSVQILDVDGDRRDDLLLVNWDNPNPFRFRLQTEGGKLGPEIHFPMIPVRSYWADDLDGDHRTEIVTIAMNSGRAQVGRFAREPAPALGNHYREGQFQVLPLTKTSKSRRGITWADVNGDGRSDLLVAEPDTGQLTVTLQQTNGSLADALTFPSLTAVSQVGVGRATPGTAASIYVLSLDERQVGLTQFDRQGRLPFPASLPADGKPLAFATQPDPTQPPVPLAVLLDREGDRFVFVREGSTNSRLQKLNAGFKSNPARMAWHDADQDGHPDLVILIPYEKVKILRQVPGKDFEELDVAPPGGGLEQPWLSTADVDGDGHAELLFAQKNFLRAVVLAKQKRTDDTAAWAFTVKDQINGGGSNSRIVGAAPLPDGTNAVPLLFLLDAERRVLTVSRRDTNQVWQVIRNVQLPVTDFEELQPICLGGTRPNSIAFLGVNAVAWMNLGGERWTFSELDGYETPVRDGRLSDVVSGDLNGDGRKDLVFLDMARNYLDIVVLDAAHHLVPATRWPVFEERTFRGRRGSEMEPREALVADLTGDGKNDLVVVVHDRILVYPQEGSDR